MSNNLNQNVPGYSGNDSPETSNNDNPEKVEIIPKPEVPFVSRYGMKHAKNSLQDVEFYRATLFNLKTEPVEDRERRLQETNSSFLRRCRDPNEICAYYNEPVEDIQPEEINIEIKSEPIDEIEEDTSSLYMETEPFDLPEVYSESRENSSQINAFNPRENELENNRIQQSREPEEEIDQQDNIPITVPLVLTFPLESEEIDETNMLLVVPETIISSNTTTETPSSINPTTIPRASDLDNANTNIIENPASVQRKTRKKKDVILTPTRVSTRIKKPRIMYNI
ncbi:uncharacterized protein LOC100169360 isoform X2 [Acyrthosiphon pisum]|uniref:Uncharacterized protein n=1 Tax=Acyrthosiphon pisum TaxID=7029 RepID=A0A8R2JTS4_ACYPI|nr:uncharacterized protein LOC100169360 isoform X2 [Acyrthosiphon pisum]XP_016663161.1 uncharacterized protein LOC100169360 isoform X2 [Acyrthosiphon pisum]XP_029346158.1 uncharacterized protein LOC100169360 isoform X2 [Acyrthosiphon pisum]XP_029346160.1 uncharacterized protein LOC100169360 isoform X2 [Acyrthosiphon pisum]XP_029346162.1 uncharacterized protein LOC100169360 isoform X2 [Acyrthosiphon pisum]XP_029346167.1 uncharacterized protein LOC100169360 isoform X2 [Acyrthosiphon pisum]XP_02|eukprot:XP_016663160.1 PREDICTED: uncharacterized protein LOC100169360 [Acyrthosiphon pisum]